MAPTCAWTEIFRDEDRIALQEKLIFTDTASSLLSVWLNLSLLFTNLKYDLGYRNLAFFTIASCMRSLLPVVNYFLFSGSAFEITDSCAFNGFWNTFWSVYEVECLTHVCIERYVVAKYINNGWALIKWHYPMYQGLCILFALLYSVPPLFGVGGYALDFTCNSCTFDMLLQESWTKYPAVFIFLLRSLKSGSFMIVMLYWARKLESANKTSMKMMEQAPFNKSVVYITTLNLLCWWPITVIRGSVVLSNLLYGYTTLVFSARIIQLALWLNSISPAVTAIALFSVDEGICNALKCKSSNVKAKKKKM